MIANGTKKFLPAYSSWFDKPVVLLVKVRRYVVPLPCRIAGETDANVRVCIQPGCEFEIRKELICAVEETPAGWQTWMN
jgi:hypothetical protein